MKNLIIVGAGEFGLEVFGWLEHAQGYNTKWRFKGFIDYNADALNQIPFCNFPVLNNENDYAIDVDDIFVCSIANTKVKAKVVAVITGRGGIFTNVIHHSVIFFKNINLGIGAIISPNCVISNNCKIGNHVALNLACTIGHDVEIGDFCQISSQCDLTGHVKLGDSVFIGSSSCIIPKVKVGSNVIIGAGSVVIKNIKDDQSVFGNPAKNIM